MVCIQQCRCLSAWVQEQHAEPLVLAAPSRNMHSKKCAAQHSITPNTMAVEVLSLQGTCPELLGKGLQSRGKSKAPICVIFSLSFSPSR